MTQCPENILLAKDTTIGIHRINTMLLLSNILQYSYYELKNKLKTTENHTFSSFLCQQCLWNTCYLYHQDVVRG